MAFDLFGDGQDDDATTECSFIESIRFGTYNEMGQLVTRNATGSMAQQMTEYQQVALGFAVAWCIGLVIYACYLHHAMTNLLIKSLSHRELLPPSRHESRQSHRRSGSRSKNMENSEPDWDEDNAGVFA